MQVGPWLSLSPPPLLYAALDRQKDRQATDRQAIFVHSVYIFLRFCAGERGRGSWLREEQAGRQVPGK